MCCSCGYLLGEIFVITDQSSLLWWIELIGGNALPGVFWLVSLSIFSDHIVLRRRQYLIASFTLLIPLIKTLLQILFSFEMNQNQVIDKLFIYGAMCIELALIIHALIIASQQWRHDLIQARRYIRGAVISVSALYLVAVIVFKQLLKVEWHMLDNLISITMACLITGINLSLFQLRSSSLFETISENVPKKHNSQTPSNELTNIINSMEEQKLFQQDGLTISDLAKHLGQQEYKLRKIINGEMNYRNFNDFLNFYRIQDITDKLTQAKFDSTPILTLALDSGFRSLSSFNKAFKSTHGITPTEYRKMH